MTFIFLSHASSDKSKIRHIVDGVIASNIKVWMDDPAAMGFSIAEIESHFIRIKAGGRWRDEIDDALRLASAVLVCWSEKAKEDRKVWHSEATVARTLRKLVACRIDDVDRSTLPDDHGQEQIPDLRTDLPLTESSPGWFGAKRRPRPADEINTAVQLLVRDVKQKIVQTGSRALEKRILRDPFAPYLIDRADQEGRLGEAIEELSAPAGVRAFIIAGPDNECPDEFLERLKRHTSPKSLKGRSWYDVHVEWPFERTPAEFPIEYRRRLAQQLGLPSTATHETIAQTLAQFDRPVAVISLMHAEEWKLAEPKRIKAWLSWWQSLADGPRRFSAVPILCVKMGVAKPGWRIYPGGTAPGATVSNAAIWREAKRMETAGRFSLWSLLGFKPPNLPKVGALPVLHPVRKADADRWIGRHFELISAERRNATSVLDDLFDGSRHGVALRDFAEAMQPMFGEPTT